MQARAFWSRSSKVTERQEVFYVAVVGACDFLVEVDVLALAVEFKALDNFRAVVGNEIRVFRDNDVDLLFVKHVRQLGVGLVGRDDEVYLFEDEVVKEHVLEVAVDVLGVFLELGVFLDVLLFVLGH